MSQRWSCEQSKIVADMTQDQRLHYWYGRLVLSLHEGWPGIKSVLYCMWEYSYEQGRNAKR